ncbi:MAG: hypothetical protein EZS28_044009, partial [Streblomastix strix]
MSTLQSTGVRPGIVQQHSMIARTGSLGTQSFKQPHTTIQAQNSFVGTTLISAPSTTSIYRPADHAIKSQPLFLADSFSRPKPTVGYISVPTTASSSSSTNSLITQNDIDKLHEEIRNLKELLHQREMQIEKLKQIESEKDNEIKLLKKDISDLKQNELNRIKQIDIDAETDKQKDKDKDKLIEDEKKKWIILLKKKEEDWEKERIKEKEKEKDKEKDNQQRKQLEIEAVTVKLNGQLKEKQNEIDELLVQIKELQSKDNKRNQSDSDKDKQMFDIEQKLIEKDKQMKINQDKLNEMQKESQMNMKMVVEMR